jgi:dipeptidyl aminopeptidase/acylaminoacyl peptidase
MGLQGHSFGGYEVNYIISHTNIFAAAYSGAGLSDFISAYGSLRGRGGNGYSDAYMFEISQNRMGGPPWDMPSVYIHNSPIFRADKIVTPLLMMANKADHLVAFGQSVELFTALRRLSRRAWLLQYDNGDHVVEGNDALDLNTRIAQYFDHFLKGAPPPKWMTQGVPARLKGTETGLELDTSGKQP